jgi:hypothetical protein
MAFRNLLLFCAVLGSSCRMAKNSLSQAVLVSGGDSAGQRARKCRATSNSSQSQPMVATMSATENSVSFQCRRIRNDNAMRRRRNAIRALT